MGFGLTRRASPGRNPARQSSVSSIVQESCPAPGAGTHTRGRGEYYAAAVAIRSPPRWTTTVRLPWRQPMAIPPGPGRESVQSAQSARPQIRQIATAGVWTSWSLHSAQCIGGLLESLGTGEPALRVERGHAAAARRGDGLAI